MPHLWPLESQGLLPYSPTSRRWRIDDAASASEPPPFRPLRTSSRLRRLDRIRSVNLLYTRRPVRPRHRIHSRDPNDHFGCGAVNLLANRASSVIGSDSYTVGVSDPDVDLQPGGEVMKRRKTLAATLATLFALSGATAALGNPAPPTNGGNGAGQSGQCTGAAADRPASCQSR
jgi:hypothetical protein